MPQKTNTNKVPFGAIFRLNLGIFATHFRGCMHLKFNLKLFPQKIR